jgi:hypothetical protein
LAECPQPVPSNTCAVGASVALHEEPTAFNGATASILSIVRPPTNILAPVGRSTFVLQAGSSVTISATHSTTVTIHVDGPSGDGTHPTASIVPVLSAAISQDLSLLLNSKPAPTSQARLTRSDGKPETTRSSALHRKTMELWFHGVSRGTPTERAGAGAVVTIQPDNTTIHARHVLHGTRTCIDLRFLFNNQAKYLAALGVALQVPLYCLRRQPPGTRFYSVIIYGDLELILKQLEGPEGTWNAPPILIFSCCTFRESAIRSHKARDDAFGDCIVLPCLMKFSFYIILAVVLF